MVLVLVLGWGCLGSLLRLLLWLKSTQAPPPPLPPKSAPQHLNTPPQPQQEHPLRHHVLSQLPLWQLPVVVGHVQPHGAVKVVGVVLKGGLACILVAAHRLGLGRFGWRLGWGGGGWLVGTSLSLLAIEPNSPSHPHTPKPPNPTTNAPPKTPKTPTPPQPPTHPPEHSAVKHRHQRAAGHRVPGPHPPPPVGSLEYLQPVLQPPLRHALLAARVRAAGPGAALHYD